jgi:uncharacterized protein (DUF2141 family)
MVKISSFFSFLKRSFIYKEQKSFFNVWILLFLGRNLYDMVQAQRSGYYFLMVLLVVACLSQCASPLPPLGGPEDNTPPRIDTTESTPNMQTNFKKQRIELTFDEWIVLEDVFNQVIVSPPLDGKFTVKLRGKTVRFDFPEEDTLRANTTYTINFGEAVKDLTEKNPAENLRFVFSTGDFIDSLSVRGRIVDAFDGSPEEGVLFMLYENLADTVVRTERPFYFGKTSEDGSFQIDNLKAGEFKVFALKDVNFNYLFDLDNEEIGFLTEPIETTTDTSQSIDLRLFVEEQRLRLMEDDTKRYGKAVVKFNKKPKDYDFTFDDIGQKSLLVEMDDSLKLWYDIETPDYWKIYIQKDSSLQDTIQVRPTERADFYESARLECTNLNKEGKKNLNPDKAFQLTFNHPISSFDTSLVQLFEDTTKIRVQPSLFEVDSLLPQQIKIQFPWKEGKEYEVVLLPGAMTDFFGLQNDTIRQGYQAELRKKFGNLNLTLSDLDTLETYVIQLIFRKDNIVDEFSVSGVDSYQRNFKTLPPGNYSVQIVTDSNQNGKWDTGNYDLKIQPEKIRRLAIEQKLRANWDVDANISINAPIPVPETIGQSNSKR